jgi:hypothetical protein
MKGVVSVIDSRRSTARRAEGLGKFVQEQGESTFRNNENSMTRKSMKDRVEEKESKE